MKKLAKLIAALLAAVMLFGVIGCANQTDTAVPAAEAVAPAADGEAAPAADGEAAPAEISGSITLWTNNSTKTTDYFTKALERFNKEYPNIKVALEQFPDYATKVSQAFAAGDQGDVVFTWQSITDWAKAGKIVAVPENVYTNDEMEATYFAGATKNKICDGKYYMVSNEINVESPNLYVNMDILAKDGVELPASWIENDGPASWQELLDLAKQLTKVDANGVVVQSGLSYTYAQWEAMFPSLIWQLGGDYRDEANMTVNFKTPEAKQALEFMLKYLTVGDPDCISASSQDRSTDFEMQTAAMCIGAPWYAGTFDVDIPDTNYQVFNMPAFVEGADPICLATGGWGYCVSAKCEYPEAAWTLVKYLTSAYEDGEWAYTTGALPAHKEALSDLSYDPAVGSKDKAIVLAKKVLEYAQEDGAYMLTPSTMVYTIIRESLYQLLEDRDVDACLESIQSRTEQMIADNLSR